MVMNSHTHIYTPNCRSGWTKTKSIETKKTNFHCKNICIIVYRLHVTIMYQMHPIHVQLNSNILIHTLRRLQQYAIQIIRTVAQKDQPIHQLLSAKVLPDQAVTTTQLTVHQPLARVLVTTVTVQPLLVACLMAPLIATIHTVSKHCATLYRPTRAPIQHSIVAVSLYQWQWHNSKWKKIHTHTYTNRISLHLEFFILFYLLCFFITFRCNVFLHKHTHTYILFNQVALKLCRINA